MEYLVALDRVKQKLGDGDDAADVLAAIADKVNGLENDINLWKRRQASAESQVTSLKDLTQGQDPKEYISALAAETEKVRGRVAELEKINAEAIAKVEEYERETLYRAAATKAGVNEHALLNLVKGGLLPDLEIVGESVKVGGKDMSDYLSQPGREWLKNALYAAEIQSNQGVVVPAGGTVPSGSNVVSVNPLEDVFKSIGVFIPGAS